MEILDATWSRVEPGTKRLDGSGKRSIMISFEMQTRRPAAFTAGGSNIGVLFALFALL
jgi:hypothetical protein